MLDFSLIREVWFSTVNVSSCKVAHPGCTDLKNRTQNLMKMNASVSLGLKVQAVFFGAHDIGPGQIVRLIPDRTSSQPKEGVALLRVPWAGVTSDLPSSKKILT